LLPAGQTLHLLPLLVLLSAVLLLARDARHAAPRNITFKRAALNSEK
jgi:hypothetical protein